MSHLTNDSMLEEAKDLAEELSGTNISKVLLADIDSNDLEALWEHIKAARDILREE